MINKITVSCVRLFHKCTRAMQFTLYTVNWVSTHFFQIGIDVLAVDLFFKFCFATSYINGIGIDHGRHLAWFCTRVWRFLFYYYLVYFSMTVRLASYLTFTRCVLITKCKDTYKRTREKQSTLCDDMRDRLRVCVDWIPTAQNFMFIIWNIYYSECWEGEKRQRYIFLISCYRPLNL